jgi:UDP-N-acetylmuramoyl-L-alanyl-D-glutamate--2,6-diaminopimelate ligase
MGLTRTGSKRITRVTGSHLVADTHGVRFDADTPWGKAHVTSRVLGHFNASNLLATLAVLLASGVNLRKAVAALAKAAPVAGRMQTVGGGVRPLVVVDYAHSPDALKQVLRALRELINTESSRLICVFGCGGERDRGKRPQMGRIAMRLADHVVITSDNPRRENPRAILRDIAAGAGPAAGYEIDRRRAIKRAIADARRGDIVLIAGKGHERYQEINGVRHPFSDIEVARAALRRRTA